MARIHAYRILNQYFEDESFLNIALNEELKKSELKREDKDLCTLVTCTPYGINTQRLLVRGHRIANSSGDTDVSSDAAQIRPLLVFACVGLVLVCIVLLIRKRKKKGK